jgi:hypothetical protein
MFAQFDLEVICKKLKKMKHSLVFMNFWNEEVHCKKYLKSKTLMFEHCNFVNPMK